MPRMTGARPSPRHKLAAAFPHVATVPTPPQFLWKPIALSMWGNDVNGDCVTAEEAFTKSTTASEYLSDATVIAWAQSNGYLDGATLIDVLTTMESGGFKANGKTWDNGPPTSVDWTNWAVTTNAIAHGPVKIGVASSQLQTAVPDPPMNGWFADGFATDQNLDHCVSLCGYGTIKFLAQHLNATIPNSVNPLQQAYALFTWSSIGIITPESMIAITGEAWLRNPATLVR